MKSIYYIIIAICVSLSLISCQQRLYFPDRANTPGLTKAMEGKATISIKPQNNYNDTNIGETMNVGVGADIAFSPINHLGIIASYRWIVDRKIGEDQDYSLFYRRSTMGGTFNGKRWEIGAGYYDTFGRAGKVEIYAGYGNGSLNRRGLVLPQYNYDTRYHRFFLQPAMGFSISRFFSMTAGLRMAFLRFYDFQSADPLLKYNIGKQQQDVTAGIFPFVEPFVNMEGGYKYVKGNVQIGMSKQLSSTNIAGNAPFYISLGLVFHFLPDFN